MEADEITLFLSETLAGRYRPTRHLASGAFSGAFLARDAHTGLPVAAKILKLSQAGRLEARQEFRGEVELLERLTACDRVIDLLDSGEHVVHLSHALSGGSIPVATEYSVLELAAGSLADLILYGTDFGWPDRLRLYRDVVKGVHQMHLKRIVHRDVKAENGLVTERPPAAKIADLGRAHDTTQPPRFAVEAYLLGRGDTRFAPFEFLWLQGTQDPDEQALADLYLLGSLLFEITTGVALTALVA
ncbi:MAG TPA: protein kinase family protein, partial [Solirubrobacteraceae bacterium]|nr:protein kinase family protein [Solirubrobacteraceae bacterium]